jgi:hypothetical protein
MALWVVWDAKHYSNMVNVIPESEITISSSLLVTAGHFTFRGLKLIRI